jgi:predicted secreted protein
MKKITGLVLLLVFGLSAVWAGDVATFVDKGFSEDGKYYVFGQYGKTDKKFQGWAELYQVDIAANDYTDNGVFKTKPSAVTADKKGRDVFEALEGKSFYYFKDLKCETANMDHVLYILDDVNKTGTDEIVFKDFRSADLENADVYSIKLYPTVNGKGKTARSSFYIMLEKRDANGEVILSRKIGSPNITRKGVTNYKIERIFCDKSEKNLIFVIEKMMEDDTGTSIRYMIEAAQF